MTSLADTGFADLVLQGQGQIWNNVAAISPLLVIGLAFIVWHFVLFTPITRRVERGTSRGPDGSGVIVVVIIAVLVWLGTR